MADPITTQPDSSALYGLPLTIRKMRMGDPNDCRFLAHLSVEAFREKVVHATSVNSLPKVKECFQKDYGIQAQWFFDRVLIAEYNGQTAGLLQIKYHGDPEMRSEGSHYESLGCCDICGLVCMHLGANEKPPPGQAYVDHICVDEKFRGKGVGKLLLDKADEEARAKGCKNSALIAVVYVAFYKKPSTGMYKMEKNL